MLIKSHLFRYLYRSMFMYTCLNFTKGKQLVFGHGHVNFIEKNKARLIVIRYLCALA